VSVTPGDVSLVNMRAPGQLTSMHGSYATHFSANGWICPRLMPKFRGPQVALAKYDEALQYAPNWKPLKEAREAAAKLKI
jgi:hypothetical protein